MLKICNKGHSMLTSASFICNKHHKLFNPLLKYKLLHKHTNLLLFDF